MRHDDAGSRLGSCRHLDADRFLGLLEVLAIGLEGVHRNLGSQRSRRHRDRDDHLEVVTLAGEDLVRADRHLDVQVTCWATTGPHLTL